MSRKFSIKIVVAILLFVGSTNLQCFAEPIQVTAEFQTSRQKISQGKFDLAVDELKNLLGTKHDAAAQVEIGKVRLKQAEYEMSSALSHFSEAADAISNGVNAGGISGPQVPKTLYDLGRVYEEKLKNYMKGAEVFEKIVAEYPDFLAIDKVQYHLAICYEEIGETQKAADIYRRIVTEYPYSTFFKMAQAKMKALSIGTEGESGALEAQADLADSAESGEQEVSANLDLGDMQLEAGNYSQAENAYRKALKGGGDPESSVKAYRKLINLLDEKKKDYEGAARAVEEMVERFPDHPGNEDYIFRLGRIYEEDLQTLKTQVIDGKVRYRKSSENVKKAINYYNSVTEKYPDADVSADAFIRKGELYEKELKDYDQAKRSYKEFLRRFPTHYEAEKIREKLKEIEDY